MKKLSKKISMLLGLALLLGAAQAHASVIALSPSSTSVSNGQTVSVSISVNSEGATVSTVEAQISYPVTLLTPTSFTLAPTWTALTEPGYDQMSGGTVIKTAGYPRGFTGVQAFGTLTFRAIGAGAASIAVEGSSIAYSISGQNTVSGAQGASTIAIGAAPVVTATPANTSAAAPAVSQAQALAAIPTITPNVTAATPAIPLAANAAGAGRFHLSGWAWLLAAIVLIGLIVLGRYLYGRRKKTVVATTTTPPMKK